MPRRAVLATVLLAPAAAALARADLGQLEAAAAEGAPAYRACRTLTLDAPGVR
jgi:hypothetical protein